MKSKLAKSIMAASLAVVMAITAAGCGDSADKDSSGGDTGKQDAGNDASAGGDNQGEKEDAGSDQPAGDGNYEECTLTISWWGGDDRHNATQEVLKAFEDAYPGIKVEATYAAWTGWAEKMATAFSAGTAQDVNQVNWNWLTQYNGDGTRFLDLNQYASVIDMSQIDKKYLEECQIADTQGCVPISLTGRIFWWDKTTFDEVGIDIPTSHAELLAAGKKFQEYGEDYYPLAMGEYDRMILMVYYLESKYGTDWVVDNELQYDAAKIEEGMKFIDELEDNHVIPTIAKINGDGASSIDQNQNWIDGKYAGIWEWDTAAKKYSDTLPKDRELVVGDYFKDWGDNQGGYSKVSMGWAISANTKHPNEAALLVNFLLNDPKAAEILKDERGIPVSKAALDAANKAGVLNELAVEANGKVLSWCSNKLDPYFEDTQLNATGTGIYQSVFGGLSYDQLDAAQAAEQLIQGINSVLATAKK